MQLDFAKLPADVQLRIIRALANDLCQGNSQFREMVGIWEQGVNQHGVHLHQIVTTRVVTVNYR